MPLGFSRAGAFYYGLRIGNKDTYTAEIVPAIGRIIAPPARATDRFVGSNSEPVWSPDGQYLAYYA